ncbi:hypothetical protein LTR36_008326 [Oleoguttula mirabilis]|uniref:F-box domain-containing protein n=1 Tax=Oleoguttula mirabilis TaxID=1507867 RepID=A0AAV9J7R7_9PEZI|nr:hypothetical protein LTR36_008326 [Oleoguttula mirabilis]
MEPNSLLTTLPPELLSIITEYAEIHDVLLLRLTCREVCAAANHIFIDTYFKVRVHLYSPEALQVLVDITSHPHLIKKLERIKIEMLLPKAVCEAAELTEHDASITSRWLTEMHSLVESDAAVNLLSKTLQNLAAAKKIPMISLSGCGDGLT